MKKIDKAFLIEEISDRIRVLSGFEKKNRESGGDEKLALIYKQRRGELERLIQQIENGLFDADNEEADSGDE